MFLFKWLPEIPSFYDNLFSFRLFYLILNVYLNLRKSTTSKWKWTQVTSLEEPIEKSEYVLLNKINHHCLSYQAFENIMITQI